MKKKLAGFFAISFLACNPTPQAPPVPVPVPVPGQESQKEPPQRANKEKTPVEIRQEPPPADSIPTDEKPQPSDAKNDGSTSEKKLQLKPTKQSQNMVHKNKLTCEEKKSFAKTSIDKVLTKASKKACSQDDDCAMVHQFSRCVMSCPKAVHRDMTKSIEKIVNRIDASHCSDYKDTCPYPRIRCATRVPKCIDGQCVVKPPSDRPSKKKRRPK